MTMTDETPEVRPSKGKRRGAPIRAVRISDATWEAATARAERDGTSVSAVARDFITAYASGEDLSKLMPVTSEDVQRTQRLRTIVAEAAGLLGVCE